MKKIVFFALLFFSFPAFAQTAEKADRLFTNRQFVEAGEMYEALLRRNPNSALFNYRFARCMYEQGKLELARTHFYRSGTRYALTHFYLGQIYFALGEFQQAIEAFKEFLRRTNPGNWRVEGVRERIAQAEFILATDANLSVYEAASLLQMKEAALRYLNDGETSNAISLLDSLIKIDPQNDELNFNLARALFDTGNRTRAQEYFLRVRGREFSRRHFYLGEIYFFNYEFGNATAAYQQYLSTLRAGNSNIPHIQRRIRQSEQAARMLLQVEDIAIIDSLVVNKSDFLQFYRLASQIGSLSHENFTLNNGELEQKITFILPSGLQKFSSDFLNGQMAIFTSHRLLNTWSSPRPLDINLGTGANMNYPFVMTDGVTMFFASDGEGSIGGYDIFITRYFPASNSFLPPENLGMPFNSPFNDFMLVIDELNNVGWFASDRFQPPGKVIIYSFVPNSRRIEVHSNDIAELRSRAKLSSFRRAEIAQSAQTEGQDATRAAQTAINLIDRISQNMPQATTSENNENNLNRRELRRITEQTATMRTQLNSLRQEYVLTQDPEARASLVQQIRELDRHIQENERTIRHNTR